MRGKGEAGRDRDKSRFPAEMWENDGEKEELLGSNFCIRQGVNFCCSSYSTVILLIKFSYESVTSNYSLPEKCKYNI